MKKSLKHIIFILGILLILLGGKDASAQKIDAFARVSVSPREGVVRQPYKVTIHVHSSTWFAKPLQFANLQVENAFIIPFSRTVSGIDYINKKKYATLTFYYLVFPYEIGEMLIPELEINTSIPPEGDYKGQPVTIKTKSQKIRVGEVPSTKELPVWMVAKNVSVKESWSKNLQTLKVGDVVERKIVISAEGTLPSLILPMEIIEPENVSIYPAQPELQDKRNDHDANGVRTETYSYLLEKEGELIIPEHVITWWNPTTKKVYQRTLSEQKLNVAPNPDLAMMESLKDSLRALNPIPVDEEITKSIPWMYLFLLLPAALLFYFAFKLILRLVSNIKARKAAYLESEAWYFKQLQSASKTDDKKATVNALYRWFDHTRIPGNSATVSAYLPEDQKSELENYFVNKQNKTEQKIVVNSILTYLRKEMTQKNKQEKNTSELNPS
ncbi:MAG: hypothetical protein ACK5M7_01100 [Draconibacterium sp.]